MAALAALRERPQDDLEICWRAFQLNPDMPREGVDKRTYLAGKFGEAQLTQVHLRLKEMSRAAGAEIDPDTPKRIPNTLDAHRLIHWAGLEGRQNAAVAGLFRAYWREGRDIGNPGVLADIAASAGMADYVDALFAHHFPGRVTGARGAQSPEQADHQVEAAHQEVNKAESGHYPRLDLVASVRRENFRSNVNPISNTTTSVGDSSSTSTTTGSTSSVSTGSAPLLNESSNSNFTTTSNSAATSSSRFNAEQNLSTRRRTTNHVVGVELNVPLFSGGAVSARTRQVAARLIQAQAEMDARVDEVLLELNRQLRLQQSTTLRVQALEQAVESGRIAVDATIKSTAAGVRTNLDVLNARERLVTAERELADARYAHLLAFLRLRFNAGVLTEDDLMQLAGR